MAQAVALGVIEEGESGGGFLAAERGRSHLSVGERKMVVEGVQIQQKPVQVVAQRTQDTAVARFLASCEEKCTKHLKDVFNTHSYKRETVNPAKVLNSI